MKKLIAKWRRQADNDDVREVEAGAFGEPEFDKCAVYHGHRASCLRECADDLEAALEQQKGVAPAPNKPQLAIAELYDKWLGTNPSAIGACEVQSFVDFVLQQQAVR